MAQLNNWNGLLRSVVLGALACLGAPVAYSQGFNIDLNVAAPPNLGGGVPSPSFGAAASQPGVWNSNTAQGQVPFFLTNLDGSISTVLFTPPVGGSSGGFNNPSNTGDFALLQNDGRDVWLDYWTFSGLQTGWYRLYTYASQPSGIVTNAFVTVGNASVPTQIVTGPMPGNQFILGITHCIHNVLVDNGTVTVSVQQGGTIPVFVNGFQLASVPEPATMGVLAMGILISAQRRKRRPPRDKRIAIPILGGNTVDLI
jgi:hypothetical protein